MLAPTGQVSYGQEWIRHRQSSYQNGNVWYDVKISAVPHIKSIYITLGSLWDFFLRRLIWRQLNWADIMSATQYVDFKNEVMQVHLKWRGRHEHTPVMFRSMRCDDVSYDILAFLPNWFTSIVGKLFLYVLPVKCKLIILCHTVSFQGAALISYLIYSHQGDVVFLQCEMTEDYAGLQCLFLFDSGLYRGFYFCMTDRPVWAFHI